MIIVRAFGGLGNQLFQYAAARSLAAKNNTNYKIDTQAFATYALREFELLRVLPQLELASEDDVAAAKPQNKFVRFANGFAPHALKRYYREPHFHFDPKFFHLGKAVYLEGYFQSERYFSTIAAELKDDLDLSNLVSEEVLSFAKSIREKQSVAIHIRLGDYQNKAANEYHGTLSSDYYTAAVNYIKNKLGDPEFLLFSDIPQQATMLLTGINYTTVSGSVSLNHFEDLYLMSQCRHNIIANSSFSWWSAWLNNHQDKIVVAPKNWFQAGPKDTEDLLPESWIKI